MNRLTFRYESSMILSVPVTTHSWLLRSLPKAEQFQRVVWESLLVEAALPDGRIVSVPVRTQQDAFGNRIQFGCILQPHARMSMTAVGAVELSPYRICGTAHPMFLPETPRTMLSPAMLDFLHEIGPLAGNADSDALRVAEAVHDAMTYAPGETGVDTTAAQAFETRRGVCQDYAHITLALLRRLGIPARYVCGFLSGEGATHAWVEFFHRGVWLALDPTHGRAVKCDCIKVAHGRDSSDCPVNRGTFTGRAVQRNTVSIKVEQA